MSKSSHTPNCADVLERILVSPELRPERRRNFVWALRRMAKILNCDLGALPAHPGELGRRLNRVSPAQLGMTVGTWRNLRSSLLGALRFTGFPVMPGRYALPMTPAWQSLYDQLNSTFLRAALTRFARWAGTRRIEPPHVTDTVMDEYRAALTEESLRGGAQRVHRLACVAWNEAVRTIPSWPQQLVSVPCYQNPYVLTFAAFPASLEEDVKAWLSWTTGASLVDDGPARLMSAKTATTRRFQVRQVASAAVQGGQRLENITSLRDLVNPAVLEAAFQFLLGRAEGVATRQISDLAVTLRSMAVNWVKVGAELKRKLATLCRKVATPNEGMSAKNRERLLQFEDPANVARLVALPIELMREALREENGRLRVALLAQTAVAIEIELLTALRLGNLAGLDLAKHLRMSLDPSGSIWISIPASEVKNRRDLLFELPPESAALVRIYIERFRPRLAPQGNGFLFPGLDQNAKDAGALSRQITRTIRDRTGLIFHVHLFRHLAGKLHLARVPGDFETLRQFFGHRSIDTTTSFYVGTDMPAAARRVARSVLASRESIAVQHSIRSKRPFTRGKT